MQPKILMMLVTVMLPCKLPYIELWLVVREVFYMKIFFGISRELLKDYYEGDIVDAEKKEKKSCCFGQFLCNNKK